MTVFQYFGSISQKFTFIRENFFSRDRLDEKFYDKVIFLAKY